MNYTFLNELNHKQVNLNFLPLFWDIIYINAICIAQNFGFFSQRIM